MSKKEELKLDIMDKKQSFECALSPVLYTVKYQLEGKDSGVKFESISFNEVLQVLNLISERTRFVQIFQLCPSKTFSPLLVYSFVSQRIMHEPKENNQDESKKK